MLPAIPAISCAMFRRHYSAFRDGQEPARVEVMTEHLEDCPGCRARHHALDIGVRVLRAQARQDQSLESRSARLRVPIVLQAELPV
jgi:predicted anti-sigma-YlaC factor YlaD